METRLVQQRNDKLTHEVLSLPPSEIALGRELDITVANSKTEIVQSLSDEIFRLYSEQPPEAIEWVFRRWRDKSDFMPSIKELKAEFKLYEMEQIRRKQALEKELDRQKVAAGETVPYAEIKAKFIEVLDKAMAMPETKISNELKAKLRKRTTKPINAKS